MVKSAAQSAHSNGAHSNRAEPAPPPSAAHHVTAQFDPSLMMLPYVEVSRALLRAHHNAIAMMEANRTLADQMRAIVRRQQDLALEIAESVIGGQGMQREGAPANDREGVFQRAADAVREIGEAMISAQLNALDTLQAKARDAEEPFRASA